MHPPIHPCVVAFALLAFGLLALAQPEMVAPAPPAGEQKEPTAPWRTIIIKPADGKLVIVPRNPAIAANGLCYRIIPLAHTDANVMVQLFTQYPGHTPALAPFIPDGIFVSRCGDRALLVTGHDEKSLDQVAQLVRLSDQPAAHLMLEILLVDSQRAVLLPVNPDGGPLQEELSIFLRRVDTTIYRGFLEIEQGQQGVLDLARFVLPVSGILFSQERIHPDDSLSLTLQALPKGDGQPAPGWTMLTVKNGSALLLNELMPGLQPLEDPAGNLHNQYLFAGIIVSRDDRARLIDGARPLRVFFDGPKQPLVIPLQHIRVEALLPGGAWLADTVTPPASWPPGLPPFAASPSLNALLATGTAQENEALQQFIAAIDVPQPALLVQGQFIHVGEEALRRQFGITRLEDGAWPLPAGDAKLAGAIADALRNDAAKMVMPGIIVPPFGAGSVQGDGWGMRVAQAYTRGDGAISLQATPLFPLEQVIGNPDLPPLELPPNQPVIAAIYAVPNNPANDLLLFVVTATPQEEGQGDIREAIRDLYLIKPD